MKLEVNKSGEWGNVGFAKVVIINVNFYFDGVKIYIRGILKEY